MREHIENIYLNLGVIKAPPPILESLRILLTDLYFDEPSFPTEELKDYSVDNTEQFYDDLDYELEHYRQHSADFFIAEYKNECN